MLNSFLKLHMDIPRQKKVFINKIKMSALKKSKSQIACRSLSVSYLPVLMCGWLFVCAQKGNRLGFEVVAL